MLRDNIFARILAMQARSSRRRVNTVFDILDEDNDAEEYGLDEDDAEEQGFLYF